MSDADPRQVNERALTPEGVATNRRDFMGGAMLAALAVSAELPNAFAAEPGAELVDPERARRLAVLLADDDLLARGTTRVYSKEFLTAISFPVGGIGSGCIQFNGKAQRHSWQIFNNFEAVELPHSFLAVRAQVAGGQPVVRALQTEAAGPFAAMESLRFRGEYPLGWYDFDDPRLPVEVSMEVFNPLIPLCEKDSAIPCALWNLTATNTADRPVTVSFLATQENVTGFGEKIQSSRLPRLAGAGNTSRVLRQPGVTMLHMTTDCDRSAGGYGDMVLVAFEENAEVAASWKTLGQLWKLWSADGVLRAADSAVTTSAEQALDGALAVPFVLQPGERRTARFALTWHFPNARHGRGAWGGTGNYYTTWWSNARDVAGYLRANLDELTRRTRLYHDTLYASNLPQWLLDRVGSQVAVLRSKTCFWTRDGYFGGWEGCWQKDGSWGGNCTHVWHYAQTPARLYPAIARRMREQSLGYQDSAGGIPHRHPTAKVAFDGQCGEILGAYREHLMSAGRHWLDGLWPRIRKAMEYTVHHWDADEDGLLSGLQWNTMDGDLSGSSSWLGGLYLAALTATEKMALLEGDATVAARCQRIRRAGAAAQDRTLFNGEYYIQIPDNPPGKDYAAGCSVDQVLGQWWAAQVGLERPFPPDHVRAAMRSLLTYNFHVHFHGVEQKPRNYVAPDDAGMQPLSWPKGHQPQPYIHHAGSVFSGLEYSAAATMIQAGMLREGLLVAKAVADRYNGRLRTGLTNTTWGYSGNPFGDDEAGKFYTRAMSVWSLLLACQGFLYDGPAGTIGFAPVWRPEDHASFFTAAEGWGLFRQSRTAAVQQATIELHYGRLRLEMLVLQLPAPMQTARVTLDGKPLAAAAASAGGELRIQLDRPVVLQTKDKLQVRIELQPANIRRVP